MATSSAKLTLGCQPRTALGLSGIADEEVHLKEAG